MENRAKNPAQKHIGIDFGRNITVIAAEQEPGGSAVPVALSGISKDASGPCGSIPLIPSVIHYRRDRSFTIGEEAVSAASSGTGTTLRWLAHYLCEKSPVLIPVGSKTISYQEAGADFLKELIKCGGKEAASATFTRPFGAPAQYDEWLIGVAESAGIRASTIDIGYAVIKGYDLPFEDRERYVIIDANAESLEVTIITPERDDHDFGIYSRILGSASADWGLGSDDGIAFEVSLNRTVARAFSVASMYGCDRNGITAVVIVGERSPDSAVHEAVLAQFPETVVRCDRGLDAAARGAATSNTSQKTFVKADYALRYWDPLSREHRYRLLVRTGARFPSAGQVARIVISAAYDGQVHLGIPLCRIANEEGGELGAGLEIVGTPGGGLRLAGSVTDCSDTCKPVEVSQKDPVYVSVCPPAQKGVPRLELTFALDSLGYLCVTARDLSTGALLRNSERIHKLG